jgi:hypothetical protein
MNWPKMASKRNGTLERTLQPWPRYPLFESKFHRDSDLETPVAVFVLEVERYAVTSGTVVRAIELAEPIDKTFVDGALAHLIVAVIEVETGLCRRERCHLILRNGLVRRRAWPL